MLCCQAWNVPGFLQLQGLCMNSSHCLSHVLPVCAALAHSVPFRVGFKMTFSERPSKVASSIMSHCFSLCPALTSPLLSYALTCYYLSAWGCALHENVSCLLQGVGQPLVHSSRNTCSTIDWLNVQLINIPHRLCFLGLVQYSVEDCTYFNMTIKIPRSWNKDQIALENVSLK